MEIGLFVLWMELELSVSEVELEYSVQPFSVVEELSFVLL